jgi:hypothetical protein
MAKIRIGFSSDFVLENSEVGIGTTNPTAKLQVVDTLKGDFNITGVSTLTVYGGFAAQKQNVTKDSSIGFSTTGIGTFTQPNERESGFTSLVGEYNTVSEDLIVDEGKIFEVSTTNITGITTLGTQEVYAPDDSVVSVGTLESVSIQSHFSVPDGGINDRPDQPTEGMVRFNDDLNTLEFYNGNEWRQFTVSGASGRGVFAGANAAGIGASKIIGYITISTRGNEEEFGDLDTGIQYPANGNLSSSTRGLTMGGSTPTYVDNIQYITIASKGNGIDFGNLTDARHYGAGMSSSTRAIVAGGYDAPSGVDVIDYVEIATIGNAVDFGDTNVARRNGSGCASPTRGVFGGGLAPNSTSDIQFITISSKGNSKRFGDLTTEGQGFSCGSNSIRALFNGMADPVESNTIQYVTIASEGNAIDFGDMTVTRRYSATPTSATRAVFGGGGPAPSTGGNVIDYVDISTTGNAVDFGDLFKDRTGVGSISDSHGGLGGF